jgi:D-lyxose ketol-isomerase
MKFVIGAVAVALLIVGTGCQCPIKAFSSNHAKNITAIQFDNAWFYDKDGKFIEERGKEAYIAVMKYHGYPVFPGMKEKLWVSDYGTGEFTKLGLGALMFMNNDKDPEGYRFMLMDLFLLPGQMLPEHYHLKSAKSVEKMEGWLVRHGSVTIVGEGEPTPGLKERQPKSQSASSTVFNGVEATPGTFIKLNRVTARHSQLAGPEGAIETEVANFHDNSAVRHTNEKLIF